TLSHVLGEYYTPALKCEVDVTERENSGVDVSLNQGPVLQDYRYELQDFQENMYILLNKITEEYNKLLVLQMQLSKIQGQQIDGMELGLTEENLTEQETEISSAHLQMTNSQNIGVDHKYKLYSLQDVKKIQQLEEQIQELEKLISSLQQQLKETEESYGAKIYCLQEKLQAVSESTVQTRYLIL
ncbi:PREDICTED: A-kinase anchor protein 9-like, partial [Dipodomys ordii]|uniref:A-kinase anchor protein 9-like n=1 Tax=Dipodomys ordii TaxID=10020 RepID=A0A1S3GVC2_DIPOR